MPEQYVATDKRTGFEVQVTGEFPEHPDDRMRIARTTTLFTRLMSTLLERDEATRRTGFRAIETQLELADALIRQDHDEVQRLVRETLATMGIGEEVLRDLASRLADASGMDPEMARELGRALGLDEDLLEQANPLEAEAEEAGDSGAGGGAAGGLDPSLLEAIREAMGPSADEVAEGDAEGGEAAGGEAEDRAAAEEADESGGSSPPDDGDEPPLAGAGRA